MERKSSYIYGRNAIVEALASGSAVEKIFISYNSRGKALGRLYSEADKARIPYIVYDKKKFEELAKKACPPGAKHQGVIAFVSIIDYAPLSYILARGMEQGPYPVIVALDGITDPHNLGAVARSVECAGGSGLLLPERNSAPVTAAALKASAGALGHISVAKVANLSVALDRCKKEGFWVAGTAADAVKLYSDGNYDRPLVLVIGAEGKGIRPSIRKKCDLMIGIPMAGKIPSLNASVSAGIILFERLRQLGSVMSK